MSKYLPTLAFDFDGVIHAYRKGWFDGSVYDDPMPHAGFYLHNLIARYNIFILTSRRVDQVIEWMAKHFPNLMVTEIPQAQVMWQERGVIGVTNKKLPAIAYIDDRAIHFEDWTSVVPQVEAIGRKNGVL